MSITKKRHITGQDVPPEILEPYRRWKNGELHPQEVHEMVDTHMEAFVAEFCDIADEANRSDIAYTEGKIIERVIQRTQGNRFPLITLFSISLLVFMLIGGWLVHTTSKGINALHQQIQALNEKILQQKFPVSTNHTLKVVPASTQKATPTEPLADRPKIQKKAPKTDAAPPVKKAGHHAKSRAAPLPTSQAREVAHLEKARQRTITPEQKKWMIVISSHLDRKKAEQSMKTFQSSHSDARLSQVRVHGKVWYRVILPGFSRKKALNYLKTHKHERAFSDAWVGKID